MKRQLTCLLCSGLLCATAEVCTAGSESTDAAAVQNILYVISDDLTIPFECSRQALGLRLGCLHQGLGKHQKDYTGDDDARNRIYDEKRGVRLCCEESPDRRSQGHRVVYW